MLILHTYRGSGAVATRLNLAGLIGAKLPTGPGGAEHLEKQLLISFTLTGLAQSC